MPSISANSKLGFRICALLTVLALSLVMPLTSERPIPTRESLQRGPGHSVHQPSASDRTWPLGKTTERKTAPTTSPIKPCRNMLSIGSISNLGFHYYALLAVEAYYLSGGPPGEWAGQAARRFGLTGQVKETEFTRLLHGFAPDGSKRLVQNAGRANRQSGHDLVFSPPKSVSVVWAEASPTFREDISRITREVVLEILKDVESRLCFTRRGKGGKKLEHAEVAFAIFEHATSRALDPQLHHHAVMLNIAVRSDSSTGTLVTRPIFEHKMELGRAYRERLADRLERELGLALERKEDSFEIRDVPQELCKRLSTRRTQIEAALAEHAASGAVAAKVACLDTRDKKREVPLNELFAAWAKIGREHAFERAQADALFFRVREQELNRSPIEKDGVLPVAAAGEASPRASLPTPDLTPVAPKLQEPRGHEKPFNSPLMSQARAQPLRSRSDTQVPSPLRQPTVTALKEAALEPADEPPKARHEADSRTLSISVPSRRHEQVKPASPASPPPTRETPHHELQRISSSDPSQTAQMTKKDEKSKAVSSQTAVPLDPFLAPATRALLQSPSRGPSTSDDRGKHRQINWVRTTRNDPGQAAPDRGTLLWRVPFTHFEFRLVRDPIAPKAPAWSPFRAVTLPKLVFARNGDRMDVPARRYSVPYWQRTFGPLRLSAHRMRVFPWALWSPVARLEMPILAINRSRAKQAPLKPLPPFLHPYSHRPEPHRQPLTKTPERLCPLELSR